MKDSLYSFSFVGRPCTDYARLACHWPVMITYRVPLYTLRSHSARRHATVAREVHMLWKGKGKCFSWTVESITKKPQEGDDDERYNTSTIDPWQTNSMGVVRNSEVAARMGYEDEQASGTPRFHHGRFRSENSQG